MTIYQLSLKVEQIKAKYYFHHHPTKADIRNLFETIFRKLTPQSQNDLWDMMILVELLPEENWLGEKHCIFGSIKIKPIGVIENANNVRVD